MALAQHATPARFSLRALAARLRARSDSEHEQALIRIVIVTALFALMSAGSGGTVVSAEHRAGALLAGGYLAVSIGYFLCTVIAPQASPTRRLIAMVTDFATTSAFLHFGDAAAAPFYPIYLWVTLGNGFRYGLPYLAASVSAAFSGFFMVVVTTPFWQDNMGLGLGLLAALVMIPSYTASLIRKLTEAKAQAEAASHAKSRFLASMSHELRTPLNAVIGVSETLRRSRLDDDQKEMVHTIRTAGGALLSLIEDILDLSRIEANKVAVSVEPFDLHQELGDLLAMLRPQAAAKAIALEAHIDAAAPHRLLGDRRHLRQILTNLVANGIKFTEVGHVLVSVTALPARPHQGTLLRFDVADTGIGIEIEQQERIFERFTQADETVQRRYGGTGLGLAITRSLVALMDGTLSLTSQRGAGSTFSVELAFALADDRADAGGAEAGGVPAAALPERIIVVGSDPGLADEVRSALGPAPASTVSHAVTMADAARLVGGGSPPARATAVQLIDATIAGVASLEVQDGRYGGCPRIRIAGASAPATPPLGFVSTLARPIDGDRLRRALAAAAVLGRLDGAADQAGGEDKGSEAAARALSALVVEDNPINQKVTRRILEHAGHRVTVVGSGEDALDALDAGTFDVMIVDINMPGMSGLELIKLQRIAELGDRRLPIVALSADATPETRQACEEAGGDAYLTKPIEPARLLAALSDLTRAVAGADTVVAAGAKRVTSIFSHPRYRAEPSPAINWQVIKGLSGFGDAEFVIETVDEYVVNTQALIAEIRVAVAAGDVPAFRAAVHALRGTSGNVGAEGVWRLAQDSAGMTVERLRQTGQDYATRLTQELARFRNEFTRFSASQRSGLS